MLFAMSESAFVCMRPKFWVLDKSIANQARRRLLLSPPPFEDIVAGLRENVSIKTIRTEQKQSNDVSGPPPLPKRVVVVLEIFRQQHLVDLFHNSAAGIRAQCLHSTQLGTVALDYARDVLRCRAIELVAERRSGPISMDVIRKSLGLDSTKVWIHQGLWVRRARIDDRQLRIAAWEAHEYLVCKKIRDLVRYGSKAPERPAAIDLIGGWWHPRSNVAGKTPGLRALQIHTYGFT